MHSRYAWFLLFTSLQQNVQCTEYGVDKCNCNPNPVFFLWFIGCAFDITFPNMSSTKWVAVPSLRSQISGMVW